MFICPLRYIFGSVDTNPLPEFEFYSLTPGSLALALENPGGWKCGVGESFLLSGRIEGHSNLPAVIEYHH